MKIHIYIRESDLEELWHFLSSPIKYEHRIDFYTSDPLCACLISLAYEDYVLLKDWQMKSTEHPYYPKENRTKKDNDL